MPDGKVIIGTELETKSFDAQIRQVERELELLEKSADESSIPEQFRRSKDEAIQLQAEIEKTKNKLKGLTEKRDALNDVSSAKNMASEMENLGNTSSKTTKTIQSNFDKGINSLKRFALSLFSIRTVFSAVSKASSAWLAQDTELANKLQSVWYGLGSFLEPLLNYLSELLLKGLGYLNVFIKALTGVDYIAKANAKALEKQAVAQGKLNKTTQDYDFDVVRKQQDTSTSAISGGGTTDTGTIDIPDLDPKIVQKLQDLAKWLKENKELIEAVGIALGITFGAVAISNLLKNIGLLLGSAGGTGLVGLNGVLGSLATIGVITIGVSLTYKVLTGRDLVEDIENTKDAYYGLIEAEETQTERVTNMTDKYEVQSKAFVENAKAGEKSTDQIKNFTKGTQDSIGMLTDQILELDKSKNFLGYYTGQAQEAEKQQEQLARKIHIVSDNMYELHENNIITDEEYQAFTETLKNNIKELDKNGISADGLKDKYQDLTGQKYTLVLDAEDRTQSVWQKIAKKINEIGSAVGKFYAKGRGVVSWLFGLNPNKKSKGYARGGIVTQPTRALIGEAGYPEAVVPMTQDYLSTLAGEIAKYGTTGGSGTVNVYLDGRLIQRQVSKRQNDYDFATNK